ncbi:MAG: putative signal transduction protein [Bacteroidetes bacterium]|nr:putative signal transduction protein [Bacteroidota bacterium]
MRTPIIDEFEHRALEEGAAFPFKARVLEYVIELVNDPRTPISRLAAVIGWNPILMRSLSASANNAFGLPGRVRDVNLALGLLGSETIRNTVKWAIASRATRHIVNSFHYCGDLWDHSLMCALVCRAVAVETGFSRVDQAFIGGLVHDIGFLFLGDDLPSTDGENPRDWTPERDHAQADCPIPPDMHEEAGSWMLDRWETLDADIRDAVRHHHAPTGAERNPALAAVVHVADVICHRLFGGPMGKLPNMAYSARAFDALGLPPTCAGHAIPERMIWLEQQAMQRAPALNLKVSVLKESMINSFEDLDEPERFLLALHYFEGLSLEGIAGVLGTTREHVVIMHSHALQRFVAMLTEFGEWS